MSNLDELEHRLRPQLQRALTEVMPRLEAPAGSTAVRRDAVGHIEPVHLREAPHHRSQGTRWLTVAAGLMAVVGGVWWLRSAQIDTPTAPADAPSSATTPDSTPNSTLDSTLPTSAPGSGPYPLDQLDPLSAARRVRLAARIEPTPDEHADLAVAGEIMRRDCMREGGATPPALTSADHVAVRDQAIESLGQRTRMYTTDGLEALRVDGYFPDPPSSATDPLWLPITEGSFEAQLILDGCGRVDKPLRAGPVEQTLTKLMFVEVDGVTTGSRWADMALAPVNLPEFADEFPALRDCMAEAGYSNYFERGAGRNPFADFMTEPGVTEAELAIANAHADCIIATNFPTTYVETVSAVLDEFDREHQSDLAALRSERDTALELARTILTEHGIDPFTR